MHLQSVHRKHDYKVWLEEKGRRVFDPVGKIPAKVLKAVREAAAEHRTLIEDNWVYLLLKSGWLELHVSLPRITLVAYPGQPGKFTRSIDIAGWFVPEQLATLRPEIVELNREMASLRLWTNRAEEQTYDVRLSRLLWVD